MQIRDLMTHLESIAPLRLAEEWDNVGLLVGDPDRSLSGPVLLAIDTTPDVVNEAVAMRAGAIVSYHPVIFSGIKRVTTGSARQTALVRLLEEKIGVYSPHTALDAVGGGVADWLLDGCGEVRERAPITNAMRVEPSRSHKLVTFVPAVNLDAVRAALAKAGAGGIGTYDTCSFTVQGVGTFFGHEGTNPAVGESGRLEKVDEMRLEMVFPGARMGEVVAALFENHPYEVPAFDIFKLEPEPEPGLGAGRVGVLGEPVSLDAIADRLKSHLGIERVRIASAKDGPVGAVGVCPGAGGSLVEDAVRAGAEVFVTGEMRHHDVLGALDKGCSVILAGHTNTERGYMPVLAEKLRSIAPDLDVRVSERDRWPFDEV